MDVGVGVGASVGAGVGVAAGVGVGTGCAAGCDGVAAGAAAGAGVAVAGNGGAVLVGIVDTGVCSGGDTHPEKVTVSKLNTKIKTIFCFMFLSSH